MSILSQSKIMEENSIRHADSKIISGTGYMAQNSVPAWDVKYGGQQGWAPNIREFLSNQAYVSRPAVCVVLQTPKIFNYFKNAGMYHESLKAILETHATTITGLDQTLTADFDSHPVGGDGSVQEEVIDVTRAQATPTFTFVDKYGRPIQHLLDIWMRFGMMDPQTKHPMAAIINQNDFFDMGPDMYTATCLFFEPDPLFRFVDKAWLCVNMMPRTAGEVTAQRDLRSAQQLSNLSIEFTALSQVSAGVNQLATDIMKEIHTLHADPFALESAIKGYDPTLDAAGDASYRKTFVRTGKEAIPEARVGAEP